MPMHSPNFTLTLIRTPNLPPSFASFIVPLNLNKLDLRDYLYNAYGIEVRGVRSYIQQQKLTQGKPNALRQTPRQWFRPRSVKRMTVEMVKPFVWPEEPTDLSEYVLFFFLVIWEVGSGRRRKDDELWEEMI
jgi:large subunit ribosomal protein L23